MRADRPAKASATPSRPLISRRSALLAGLLVIVFSTYLLYVLIGDKGVFIDPDSQLYLDAAMSLRDTGVMTQIVYSVEEGFARIPLTQYPPVTSIFYVLLMGLGVSVQDAPTVTALLCWPLFLAGIGVLTYRLGRSPAIAVLAVALAAVSDQYLWIYGYAKSEVPFLPLLVLVVALLVDLPARRQPGTAWKRLSLVSALLALLMLTRYSGGFVWLAVVAWWLGRRLWQGALRERRWRVLLGEVGVLSLAVVPLFLWLVRGAVIGETALGAHFTPSSYSFMDGARGLVFESLQALWPAVRPHNVLFALDLDRLVRFSAHHLLFHVPLAVLLVWGVWRYRHRLKGYLLRSPIEIFLVIYLLLLYLIAQPFLETGPINGRDMATALCLLQPWALGALAVALGKKQRLVLAGGYVLLNIVFLLITIFASGKPEFLSFAPPEVESLAGQPARRAHYDEEGLPGWLPLRPHTAHALERYHPALLAHLKPGTWVITNNQAARFFVPYPINSAEQHPGYRNDDVEDWIAQGACTLQKDEAVVLFTWDEWAEESKRFEERIDRQCPALRKKVFERSILYTPPDASP